MHVQKIKEEKCFFQTGFSGIILSYMILSSGREKDIVVYRGASTVARTIPLYGPVYPNGYKGGGGG